MSTNLSISLVGALLMAAPLACSHETKAEATAEPGSARAEAKSDGRSVSPEDAYDSGKVSRTGIVVDRELAKSCDLQDAETFFAYDSAAISPRTDGLLTRLSECVSKGKLAGKELQLVGHTDPSGSDAYNEQLGMSRAESVAAYLRDHGVDASKIEIESVGERGASEDVADWPEDRRVDIRTKPATTASR
jgi:outer membrane protein OmpA-like peptidoglycan-associated protein